MVGQVLAQTNNPADIQSGWLVKNNKYAEVFYVDASKMLRWINNEATAAKQFGPNWNKIIKEYDDLGKAGLKFGDEIKLSDPLINQPSNNGTLKFSVNEIDSGWLSGIAVDSANNLYYLNRVTKGDADVTQLKKYSNNKTEVIAEGDLSRIFIDKKGNIWGYWPSLGTNDSGLFKLQGNQWVNFASKSNFLPDNVIYDIAENSKGLWIATYGGLVLYDYNTWKVFTYNDWKPTDYFKKNDVEQVEANDSYVVFGNFFDTYVYQDSKFTKLAGSFKNGYDLYLDGDELWQYAQSWDEGLFRYNIKTGNQKLFSVNDGLSSGKMEKITKDHNGNYWFLPYSTDKTPFYGIYKFDGSKFTQYNRPENMINYGQFQKIATDSKNNIYVTDGNAIYKLDTTSSSAGSTSADVTIKSLEYVPSVSTATKAQFLIEVGNGAGKAYHAMFYSDYKEGQNNVNFLGYGASCGPKSSVFSGSKESSWDVSSGCFIGAYWNNPIRGEHEITVVLS
ncbi:MAG: two-component regulator propeller domain-containing protein [Candidatus Buchananbacteria bacterium]